MSISEDNSITDLLELKNRTKNKKERNREASLFF